MVVVKLASNGEWVPFDADEADIRSDENQILMITKDGKKSGMVPEGEWLCWKRIEEPYTDNLGAYLPPIPYINPENTDQELL